MVLKKSEMFSRGGSLSIAFSILLIIFMQITTAFCNLKGLNCAMHEPTYVFAICIFTIGVILVIIAFLLDIVEKNNIPKEVIE